MTGETVVIKSCQLILETTSCINCYCQLVDNINTGHINTFLVWLDYFQWVWLRFCDDGIPVPEYICILLVGVYNIMIKVDIAVGVWFSSGYQLL